MNHHKILIAGATGTQGGAVIEALLDKNVSIRAIVRDKNSKGAQALAAKGVELFEGTFDDKESLAIAAQGATGVFSVQMGSQPSNKGEESRHARNLIEAAKTAGVQQIVHTSVARAGEHESFIDWDKGRWEPTYWEEKAAAIQAVKEAGFSYWTIIKPPLIMEGLLPPKSKYMFPTLPQGKLITPVAPDTKIDWVSGKDIGRFAAAAFTEPDKFNRKEISLVGEKLTMAELADALSAATGKHFDAESVSVDEALKHGFFDLTANSYVWMDVEGYKVDPQEAAGYGIELEPLASFLERHKSVL